MTKKILIICGPTASGKTALSIECAKNLNSEVISADSMNIYKNLNVGTAKPTLDEMQNIPHHLIDVVNEKDNFTVNDYRDIARPIIDRIIDKNIVPVVCGGTGFYIKSLIYNLSYGNGKEDPLVRQRYKDLAEKNGNLYVYEILKKVDPRSAEKIHFNDVKRVIRALEIYENGTLKSDINDDMTPVYNYDAFMIDMDRSLLYDRINKRVDIMINNGLIDEVNSLIVKGVDSSCQCMQGIGYKEIYSYLTGEITKEEAIELIKLNTRHYAKRQITFFKRLNGLKTVKFDDVKIMSQRILEQI